MNTMHDHQTRQFAVRIDITPSFRWHGLATGPLEASAFALGAALKGADDDQIRALASVQRYYAAELDGNGELVCVTSVDANDASLVAKNRIQYQRKLIIDAADDWLLP